MFKNLFASGLCAFSVCLVFWGVSPVLFGISPAFSDTQRLALCSAGDATCGQIQDDDGCIASELPKSCHTSPCMCYTIRYQSVDQCRCRKNTSN
jgi:hypothetical protein